MNIKEITANIMNEIDEATQKVDEDGADQGIFYHSQWQSHFSSMQMVAACLLSNTLHSA